MTGALSLIACSACAVRCLTIVEKVGTVALAMHSTGKELLSYTSACAI